MAAAPLRHADHEQCAGAARRLRLPGRQPDSLTHHAEMPACDTAIARERARHVEHAGPAGREARLPQFARQHHAGQPAAGVQQWRARECRRQPAVQAEHLVVGLPPPRLDGPASGLDQAERGHRCAAGVPAGVTGHGNQQVTRLGCVEGGDRRAAGQGLGPQHGHVGRLVASGERDGVPGAVRGANGGIVVAVYGVRRGEHEPVVEDQPVGWPPAPGEHRDQTGTNCVDQGTDVLRQGGEGRLDRVLSS